MDVPIPFFKKCVIVGPDKIRREGWEMCVALGNSPLVVRDTDKRALQEMYERIFKKPLPSLHWRETRARVFGKKLPTRND